jgi:hypothetical protein
MYLMQGSTACHKNPTVDMKVAQKRDLQSACDTHSHPGNPTGMRPSSLLIADLKEMLMDFFISFFVFTGT